MIGYNKLALRIWKLTQVKHFNASVNGIQIIPTMNTNTFLDIIILKDFYIVFFEYPLLGGITNNLNLGLA